MECNVLEYKDTRDSYRNEKTPDRYMLYKQTKRKGKGKIKCGDYQLVYSRKEKHESAAAGVGLVANKILCKKLTNKIIGRTSSEVMRIAIHGVVIMGLFLKRASLVYNIPRTTLRRYYKKCKNKEEDIDWNSSILEGAPRLTPNYSENKIFTDRKERPQTSSEVMRIAIHGVVIMGLFLKRASLVYNIPRTTLRRYYKKCKNKEEEINWNSSILEGAPRLTPNYSENKIFTDRKERPQ
ncbi:hypothetical protein FQA39_LY03906 [Lamprigera yunnana]|nr:hypothetical protein FQA39_LY03906 [Lamprigera yunnana]